MRKSVFVLLLFSLTLSSCDLLLEWIENSSGNSAIPVQQRELEYLEKTCSNQFLKGNSYYTVEYDRYLNELNSSNDSILNLLELLYIERENWIAEHGKDGDSICNAWHEAYAATFKRIGPIYYSQFSNRDRKSYDEYEIKKKQYEAELAMLRDPYSDMINQRNRLFFDHDVNYYRYSRLISDLSEKINWVWPSTTLSRKNKWERKKAIHEPQLTLANPRLTPVSYSEIKAYCDSVETILIRMEAVYFTADRLLHYMNPTPNALDIRVGTKTFTPFLESYFQTQLEIIYLDHTWRSLMDRYGYVMAVLRLPSSE